MSAAPSIPVPSSYWPDSRITNAVALQITIVSTNTPSIWISPCVTGWRVLAVAAAFGALPIPASFENSPRFTPIAIAWLTA